jgi:SAM-dependent methyltransferase
MDDRILAAAEVIEAPEGEAFLRFMSDAYHGIAQRNANGGAAQALATAERIGMVRNSGVGVTLTTPGFLVGNVAKEYCHYVDHGRTTAPPKPPPEIIAGKDVLDLGCSFGRSLWEFQRNARSAVGMEPQEEYIVLGRALSVREKVPAPKILAAAAEDLDKYFGAETLDVIFSRLVLNYVRIKPVLEKMIAALRPGGILWIQVDSPCGLPGLFFAGNTSLRRKGWTLLAMLNLPFCVLTGRQISVAAPGRMHERHSPAFLPLWWWRKTLREYGLQNYRSFPAPSLIFSAQKSI